MSIFLGPCACGDELRTTLLSAKCVYIHLRPRVQDSRHEVEHLLYGRERAVLTNTACDVGPCQISTTPGLTKAPSPAVDHRDRRPPKTHASHPPIIHATPQIRRTHAPLSGEWNRPIPYHGRSIVIVIVMRADSSRPPSVIGQPIEPTCPSRVARRSQKRRGV